MWCLICVLFVIRYLDRSKRRSDGIIKIRFKPFLSIDLFVSSTDRRDDREINGINWGGGNRN